MAVLDRFALDGGRAVVTGARAAARMMENGGSIINISSTAALEASPNNGPYAVAKAGVDSLTKTLSSELAPRSIRVNGVAPGPVPTEVFMQFFGATDDDPEAGPTSRRAARPPRDT